MTKEIPDVDTSFRTNIRNQIIKAIKRQHPNVEISFDDSDEKYIKFITDQIMMSQHPELTEEQRKFMITYTLQHAVNKLIEDSLVQAYGGTDGNTNWYKCNRPG